MKILNLGDAGLDRCYNVWEGIVATERFPAGAGESGANYVLALTKALDQADQLRVTEGTLLDVMKMLAAAWPFAGGTKLMIETREVIVASDRITSNADMVERALLSRSGLQGISRDVPLSMHSGCTYRRPPLPLALKIAELMRDCNRTKRLLFYYFEANLKRGDTSAWFIDLYKVRDFLCLNYGGEDKAKKALGISTREWCRFGTLLNKKGFNLRHAELGDPVTIPAHDKDTAYNLAWAWISQYLRTKGIPRTSSKLLRADAARRGRPDRAVPLNAQARTSRPRRIGRGRPLW